MTEIIIPLPEKVPIDSLKVDGQNPNRMSERTFEELKRQIRKYGFIKPVVTNKDLVIADGEMGWNALKALGAKEVSVIRLPVSDVDRRLLRQVLNKLRGMHKSELDEAEYARILAAGQQDELHLVLRALGERMPSAKEDDFNGGSGKIFESWEVVIECKDETEQKQLFERFKAEGLKCRVLSL